MLPKASSNLRSSQAETAADPFPRLPDLKLLRQIGKGSFGEVWLATNPTTRQLVAAKLIRAQREVEAVVGFLAANPQRHPNLVDLLHAGKTAEWVFYLMDPADDVKGGPASDDAAYVPATLASRLDLGSLPFEQCLARAKELLQGVAHLHQAGLVHRDVKPANCLIINGVLKLADFGLVTRADHIGSVIGTPLYMPPDRRMDQRADVYACGLVLYEMFTGLEPDAFPRLGEKVLGQVRDPRVGGLNRLILRACDANRAARFANAVEMLAELRALEGLRWRRPVFLPWRLAAISAGSLLVLASGVAWLNRPGRSARPAPVPQANVNFITMPFEAEVYIDGTRAVDATTGQVMTTPCTIHGLSGAHHVTFRLPGRAELDAGSIDFARQREVVGSWKGP